MDPPLSAPAHVSSRVQQYVQEVFAANRIALEDLQVDVSEDNPSANSGQGWL